MDIDEEKIASTEATPADAPSDANAGCVGPTAETAGKSDACAGCPNQQACSSGAFNSPEAKAKAQQQTQALQTALSNVSHVILVLSGKGGVGKSTVSAQLCHTLASQGYAVGLLDVDLCGPSAPRMVMGNSYVNAEVHRSGSGAWTPVYTDSGIAVMSISFLLQDPNAAVVWRGPRKNGMIQQFLTEVDWTGDTDGLDYLIVDTPPGTSDEHISTVQYLQKAKQSGCGAVLVTTPEEVSMADVRKELNFCQKTKLPVHGIIENMGQYQTTISELNFVNRDTGADCTKDILTKIKAACPELFSDDTDSNNGDSLSSNPSKVIVAADIFPTLSGGGPKSMAQHYNVDYWGVLPLDPKILECCEQGRSFVTTYPKHNMASDALQGFANRITKQLPVNEVGN